MVNLCDAPNVFNAQIVDHGPVSRRFITKVDFVSRIALAPNAGSQLANFVVNFSSGIGCCLRMAQQALRVAFLDATLSSAD